MGEVYRAHDSKLHRDVAIKTLPESMARDPDRLARFEREAQVLAALNHPHIAGIYGLEMAGGVQALVLELVEGPTLAQRLEHGALPVDEAIDISRQVADALEAAHEQGIIHRDLKPANIKLRPDGTIKVLDFRLAKALEPATTLAALANSPTLTSPIFSPDGRWIAFAVGVSANSGMIATSPAELRKYSLETGLTQRICQLGDFFGGVWTTSDDILFVDTQPGGVWKVPASGGEPRLIVERFLVDGRETDARVAWPDLLPGERSLLLTDLRKSRAGDLAVLNLDSRVLTHVGLVGAGARFTPTGHLVYVGQDASLMAVAFDRQTLRAAGSPVALIPGIAIARNTAPAFALSDDGTVVYAKGYLTRSRREPLHLVRISPTGARTALTFEQHLFVRGPVIASSSSKLAASTWSGKRAFFNLDRMTRLELLQGDFTEILSLALSADARRLAVAGGLSNSAGFGLYIQDVGSTAQPPETLVEPGTSEFFVAGWLPDNRTLVYTAFPQTAETRSDGTIYRQAPGETPKAIVSGVIGSEPPALSPDGRYVAFISAASGQSAIVVHSTAGPAHIIPVTTKAGNSPAWSLDGRQLYFRPEAKIFAVTVTTAAQDIAFGPERPLFDWDLVLGFTPAPRGEFYGFEPVPGATRQTSLHLQTGWFDEIKRLTARH